MPSAPIIELSFHRNCNEGIPAECDASYGQIIKGRIRRLFGILLRSLRIPGAISDTSITDPVTLQIIDISVGVFFTKISVNGRDYYFSRFTGKYDGAGMGCG